MVMKKDPKNFGVPWEKGFGYSQAVKVKDFIFISGQVSHDDEGNILAVGDMEAQMRNAYANVQKLLVQYGATMDNVVEDTLYVTDMDAAMSVAGKVREEFYGDSDRSASTIIDINRLALPEWMIEIKCIAIVGDA